MRRPPLAVIVIAALYIVAGTAGLIYHRHEWSLLSQSHQILWVSLVRALAIVAGVFLLLGKNWARALAVAWIAFHVVVGATDDVMSLVIHAMLMVIILLALFAPKSQAYFSGKTAEE
jgi:hypothetical protein